MILRESHQESRPASSAPTPTATASRATSGSHWSRSSVRGFETTIAPSASLSGSRRTGSAAARYERLLPGGVNSNVTGPFSSVTSRGTDDSASRVKPGVLAGEQRGADVVDPVARRELELRRGEVDRVGSLVGRAEGGVRVQLREPRRLALQLLHRLPPRVGLEEPQRDQRGDDAGEDDPEQEQGRQAETQRPHHRKSVGARRLPRPARRFTASRGQAAGAEVRSWATL